MNKLKRISLITLCSIILFATVTFAKTGTVNAPSGLVLRKQASKTSDPITTVNDKAKIEILEESGEWYKVKYNGNEGYLFAEYVNLEKEEEKAEEPKQEEPEAKPEEETKEELETNSENNSNKEESKYPQKQKVKSDLKIYTIPSVTAKTIVSVKKDEEVTVNYELNNWVNITYGKNTGWARKYFINNESKPVETKSDDAENDSKTNESTNVATNKKGYIDVSSSANLRKEANTSSEIINTLIRGAEVTIIGEEGDFYKIKYQDITGYMSKSLVSDKPVAEVTSRSSTEERKSNDKQQSAVTKEENTENKENTKNTENTNKSTVTSNSSAGNNIVSFAKKYLGYNYVYGGSSPSTGFDCSGFTYYVFQSCGYALGRTCQDQAKLGIAVSRQNLSAGDLIFFNNGSGGSIGHVGIYISGGQFIHSENSRTGVRIDTINSGFYNKCYYSARRIIK